MTNVTRVSLRCLGGDGGTRLKEAAQRGRGNSSEPVRVKEGMGVHGKAAKVEIEGGSLAARVAALQSSRAWSKGLMRGFRGGSWF